MNAPLADAEADEAFLRLISSDPDLFRAEFDTLISAGWGNPRVFRPSRGGRTPRTDPRFVRVGY
jgi:hypothetical protein